MKAPRGRWSRHLIGLLLLATLALSARLPGLGKGTITHPEFFTPGIELPDYVQHPRARITASQLITSVWSHTDIHPPGAYAVLWVWTKVFGTGHVAIRLPAALAGTLTVLLLAGLARRTDDWRTALAAATILALHGMHISKSVQAEIWIWPSFYAVLSALLLHRLLDRPDTPTAIAYVGVLLFGLWTEYSFWVFVGAHISFVLLRGAGQARVPKLLGLQALSLVLALPVTIHLRQDFRYGHRGYLSGSSLDPIPDLLRFGRLVDTPFGERVLGGGTSATLLLWLVAAVGGGLLLLGLTSRQSRAAFREMEEASLPAAAWLCAAALTSGVLVTYLAVLPIGWKFPLALALAAWGTAFGWRFMMAVVWPPVSRLLASVRNIPGIRAVCGDFIVYHALVPAGLLLLIGLFMRVLAPRVFMIATPFLLLLAMRGLRRLADGRWRFPAVALFCGLVSLGVASTLDFRSRERSNRAYRAVAEELAERAVPGDLIVARYAWHTAPLHYYLTPDRFDFIRLVDLPERLEASPAVKRVWIIVYGTPAAPDVAREIAEFEKALPGFHPTERFEALRVQVFAYERLPAEIRLPEPLQ